MAFDKTSLNSYVDVAARLALAYERWPELRLVEQAPIVVDMDGHKFIQITITAWRTPDDPVPCTASAWEPFPGTTPYTRNSEMMNCSTSAAGRVLGLMGIGSKASISSADEVHVRKYEQDTQSWKEASSAARESSSQVSPAKLTLS